jgi:hypothetical protein
MQDIIDSLLKSAEVYTARARQMPDTQAAYLLVKHSIECITLARTLERVS